MKLLRPIAVLLLMGLPLPLRSDTLVLCSGEELEVASVEFTEQGAIVVLPGGGRIRVPLEVVQEVVPGPVAAAPRQELPDPLESLIREVAQRYGVEPELVRAVIEVESAFDPDAVSSKGAVGLMQLLPETAGDYGVTDLFDPRENVEAGVRHLERLSQRFRGDLDLVLAAYNAGEGRVERAGGVPSIRETRRYVERVKGALRRNEGSAVAPPLL